MKNPKNSDVIRDLVTSIVQSEQQLVRVECDVVQLVELAMPGICFERISTADDATGSCYSIPGVFLFASEDRSHPHDGSNYETILDIDEVFLLENGVFSSYNRRGFNSEKANSGSWTRDYVRNLLPAEISYDRLYDSIVKILSDHNKILQDRVELSKSAPSLGQD